MSSSAIPPNATFVRALRAWLRGFVPHPVTAGRKERLAACAGAFLGLLLTEWLSHAALGEINPWFIAPMGASAVLLFAVPLSPLAQPWSIIGGNFFSAVIGVACARYIHDPAWAAGAAVSLAICAMFALRCVHPPSGAVALTAVLGGPAVTAEGFHFAFTPVLANSALLLACALVFNNLARRRYPHPAAEQGNAHQTADLRPTQRVGFTRADLDAALRERHEILDITEEDLEDLLVQVEMRAFARHAGGIRCEHIMARDVVSAQEAMPVAAAWDLLSLHRIHAIPVVDADRRLTGIVTMHDLLMEPGAPERPAAAEPPHLLTGRTVGEVMHRPVRYVQPAQSISELIPAFSDEGFHHLPVVDGLRRVVGMVTQSDLIAALYRGRLEEAVRKPQLAAKRA